MSDGLTKGTARRKRRLGEWVSFALVALSVWLGWQVVRELLVERLPGAAALSIAPASPVALRRAAEAELGEDRTDNAEALARESLIRAPFSVQALRVFGLTEAKHDRRATADNILTLAGNWSLRDDPSHAWLLQNRLRNGDYYSAFAHADTLARRRVDLQPDLFRLFTTAGTADPRSLPALAALLKPDPPWRQAFLETLLTSDEKLRVGVNLAVLLNGSSGRLSDLELTELYNNLISRRQYEAVRILRARLGRPPIEQGLTNGSFDGPRAPKPFDWTLNPAPGIIAEILPSESPARKFVLRVEYNGYAAGEAANQIVQLLPGAYRFSGQRLAETGSAHFRWSIRCLESGNELIEAGDEAARPSTDWKRFNIDFRVPADSCALQSVRLLPISADRRSTNIRWFDQLAITSLQRDSDSSRSDRDMIR